MPSGLVPREFARHVTAGARRLFDAWNCLDGVQAFEGFGPLPDPDEPGAALCHAARNVIPAWRQPSGTSADRDATIRRFITATGFVSAATLGLATYAPRPPPSASRPRSPASPRPPRTCRRPSLKPPTIRRPDTGRDQHRIAREPASDPLPGIHPIRAGGPSERRP